jgi:hypothetical protein
LAAIESFPDALEGSVTPRTVDGFDGRGDAANDGVPDKVQQRACGDAQTSDLVGEPDTEGSSAAASSMTVAAKDASCPECSLWWVAVVESVENAVAVECADSLAVWTRGLFEPLDDGDPFFFAAVEPSVSFVAHVDPMLPGKSLTLPAANWAE